MGSIISLAVVDNNVDPKGIGRIRVKLTGVPTGPIEKARDYEPWDENDPFIANPFLPTNINFIPEIGQSVKIIVYNPDNDLVNREYIAGPFTTVHDYQSQTNSRQVENTSYGSNVKKMNNVFSENGTYVKEKSEGTISNLKDYAIYGPYGSDVLFTENGLTLRGGKLVSKDSASDKVRTDIINFPVLSEKRSILSLKKFGTKQELKEEETVIEKVPYKKLSYIIEYNINDTNTGGSSYTIDWYVYEVKKIYGQTFNTNVFSRDVAQDLSSYSEQIKLINTDGTSSSPSFSQTASDYQGAYIKIRTTLCELNNDGLRKFDGNLHKVSLHPFYYRPVKTLNSVEFLSKIRPGCFGNSTVMGSGLVFSPNEPTPKPITEKKKEKILKTVSTTLEQSFSTLSSDKIFMLSTDTNVVTGGKKILFNKLDKYEYTQEDLLSSIEPNTFSTVRGETLLEFLDVLTRVIAGHAHQPTKPMVKNGYSDWDKLVKLRQTLENDILNKSIRIN